MRNLAVFFIVMFLGTTAGWVEAREFKEIPLPSGIKIFEPVKGLDDDLQAFLGVWEGKWGDSLPSIFIVTHIDPETEVVKGIYGWGKGRNFDAGSTPFTGRVEIGKRNNNVVKFEYFSAKISFRVPKNGNGLKGKFKMGSGRPSVAFFSPTELDTDPVYSAKAVTGIPEAYRNFLGDWCGVWNNQYATRLTVMAVNNEGAASGYYAFMRKGNVFNGTIEDGELRITLKGGAKQEYRVENDGTLSGIDRRPRSISTTRSKRCD